MQWDCQLRLKYCIDNRMTVGWLILPFFDPFLVWSYLCCTLKNFVHVQVGFLFMFSLHVIIHQHSLSLIIILLRLSDTFGTLCRIPGFLSVLFQFILQLITCELLQFAVKIVTLLAMCVLTLNMHVVCSLNPFMMWFSCSRGKFLFFPSSVLNHSCVPHLLSHNIYFIILRLSFLMIL